MPLLYNLVPEISNGHVATTVQSNTIYMNGLYNGANVSSHRARIPSTAAVIASVDVRGQSVDSTFRLDLGRGLYVQQLHLLGLAYYSGTVFLRPTKS